MYSSSSGNYSASPRLSTSSRRSVTQRADGTPIRRADVMSAAEPVASRAAGQMSLSDLKGVGRVPRWCDGSKESTNQDRLPLHSTGSQNFNGVGKNSAPGRAVVGFEEDRGSSVKVTPRQNLESDWNKSKEEAVNASLPSAKM